MNKIYKGLISFLKNKRIDTKREDLTYRVVTKIYIIPLVKLGQFIKRKIVPF